MNNQSKTLWPRISVVTPSFNQGPFLRETIDSVLSQGYPNLEYIVLDGGSTDDSVEIIRSFARHLAYWHSRPDHGQADALATGFEMSTGAVLAWLNSDDLYLPGALARIGEAFRINHDAQVVYGDYVLQYPDGRTKLKPKVSFDFNVCLYAYLMIPQPSAFWRREAYFRVGGLDTSLHYAMDYDFFLRLGREFAKGFKHLPVPLSIFRVHPASKSVSQREGFRADHQVIRARFTSELPLLWRAKRRFYMAKLALKFLNERGFVPLRKEGGKA